MRKINTKQIYSISVSVPASAGFVFEVDKDTWDILLDTEKHTRLTNAIRNAASKVESNLEEKFTGISVDTPSAYVINEIDELEDGDIIFEEEESK